MIIQDNCWVDENNNIWNCKLWTEEEAIEASKTLINCHNCSDCFDCKSCSNCHNCKSCIVCRNCSDCTGCIASFNCVYCNNCRDCFNCNTCHDYKTNPQRYVFPEIKSHDTYNTCVYWTNKNDIQVVHGCFKGNLDEFKELMENKYKADYLKQIGIIEYLVKE